MSLAAVEYAGLAGTLAGQAMGAPLPGETALIAAAVLASRGRLEILPVLAAAAAGAVTGGMAGYAVGRAGGRWLLGRPGALSRRRRRLLESGEGLFRRHGARAVLLARWISGARIVIAPLAGVHRMGWRAFMTWNALGGVLWPASVGLVAFALGRRTAVLVGALTVGAGAFALLAWRRRRRGAL